MATHHETQPHYWDIAHMGHCTLPLFSEHAFSQNPIKILIKLMQLYKSDDTSISDHDELSLLVALVQSSLIYIEIMLYTIACSWFKQWMTQSIYPSITISSLQDSYRFIKKIIPLMKTFEDLFFRLDWYMEERIERVWGTELSKTPWRRSSSTLRSINIYTLRLLFW